MCGGGGGSSGYYAGAVGAEGAAGDIACVVEGADG